MSGLASFPKLFFEYANAIQAGKRRYAITCATAHAAALMRLDLYRFRKGLQKEGMLPEYPEFFAARFYVRGRRLLIWHADEGVPA